MFRWVGLLTEVAVGFIITPLLVRHLGEASYGIWLVVVSTVALFGFLDLGLVSAVTKHLSVDLARGDCESVWATVSKQPHPVSGHRPVVSASYLTLAIWGAFLFNWGVELAHEGRSVLVIMGLCVARAYSAASSKAWP